MGSYTLDGGPTAAYREVHDEGAQLSSEEEEDWAGGVAAWPWPCGKQALEHHAGFLESKDKKVVQGREKPW